MLKKASILKNRVVVRISGKENEYFLNNILTNDISKVEDQSICITCLLTPQGKILFDLFVFRAEIRKGFFDYFIECSEKQAINLIQKLKLYSLRLDVSFKKESLLVVVSNFLSTNIGSKKDVRFSNNEIYRSYIINNQLTDTDFNNYMSNTDWYNHLRFLNCCPEGEIEIPSNFLYPFEIKILYDNGICFDKGCFIGQEVIARVKYRGKSKKQLMCFKINSNKIIENGVLRDHENKPVGTLIHNTKIGKTILGFGIIKLQSLNKNSVFFFESTNISLI